MSDKRQESERRLRYMIEPLLKRAQNDLAKTGRVTPVVILLSPEGKKRAIVPFDDTMASMLESGQGKDYLFDSLRRVVQNVGASGFAFLSDAWMGRTTEAGRALGKKDWVKLMAEFDTEELAAQGLVTRTETIMISAQVPEWVLMVTQPYVRGEKGSITYGKREEIEMPQDEFEGRQKMFGDTSEERLHLHRHFEEGETPMNDDEPDLHSDADPREIATEMLARLDTIMSDFERLNRRRLAEKKRARFGTHGKFVKRTLRNQLIAEQALVRERLGPHAELWITYNGSRNEALSIRADVELAERLPLTVTIMDPDALNGYVAFDKRHAPHLPAGEQNLVQYIPVHGGITYAHKDSVAAVWGFDTMHYRSENEPRTDRDWIRAHCWILYRGLLLAGKHWKEFSRAGRERKMEIVQELLDLVPEQAMQDKLGFTALLNTLMGKVG